MRRRLDHRLVAGEIGLARQDVHDLRAGDARDKLERESHEPGVRHALQRGLVAIGIHQRDDRRTALVAGEILRPAHLEDEIGVGERRSSVRGYRRAHLGKARVRHAGRRAGAALDRHLGAEGDELLHRFRRRRNARLDRRVFLEDCDPHQMAPVSRTPAP